MLVAIIINLVYSWYYHANYRIKGSGPVLITNLKHGELAGITLIFFRANLKTSASAVEYKFTSDVFLLRI